MVTRFPAQIDSFSIKSPQEVILAEHVNSIQEAIIAIEVYVKSLEETLSGHIDQTIQAHEASAISLDPSAITGITDINLQDGFESLNIKIDDHIDQTINAHQASSISVVGTIDVDGYYNPGLGTTNTQLAIEGLKTQIEAVEQSNLDVSEFNIHLAENIEDAHSGQLPGSRISDNSITGDKIIDGEIELNHLNFDVSTQAELDAHTSLDIENAHSGLLPLTKLDTDVATQAELDAHTSDSTGVHGIDSLSSVMGTLDSQNVYNKTIISDFDGSKILIFKEQVTEEEENLYKSFEAQLEVRERSTSVITVADHTSDSIITVSDAYSFYSDLIGVEDGIQFIFPPNTLTTSAKIVSLNSLGPSSTELILDNNYPTISTNNIAVHTIKAQPYFSVDLNGNVKLRELHVTNGAFNDIEFDDDVSIQGNITASGNLEITGTTLLKSATTIRGGLNISIGSLSVASAISAGSSISGGTDLIIGNNATFGNDVTIGGDLTIQGNIGSAVDFNINSLVASGTGTFAGDFSIGGGLDVTKSLSLGGPLYVGSDLDVARDGYFGIDLEVANNHYVRGSLYVENNSTFQNRLNIGENIVVGGKIIGQIDMLSDHIDGTAYNHSAEKIIYDNSSQPSGGVLEGISDCQDAFDNIASIIDNIVPNPWQSILSSPGSELKNGDRLFIDTLASSVTIQLPSSPSLGNSIRVVDSTGNWNINNVVVTSTSHTINGVASPYTINVSGLGYEFLFHSATNNWIVLKTS